jgi:diacylglycerol O-acyltransferase / wax synthase
VRHAHYTPLSGQDMDFLLWESPALQMHGSAVEIFEAGPLAKPDGGIDFETVKRSYAAVLHRMPRYRQKLAWVPGVRQAVWVDDEHFNLDYHMRHTALPRPGSEAQLKRMAARIMEQPLDRSRPLWELWVVEGLSENRFAVISKTHHCVFDGAAGMGLMSFLLSPDPQQRIPDPPRFVPQAPPGSAELSSAWRRHLWRLPLRALQDLRDFVRDHDDLLDELQRRARALGELAMLKFSPASETALNGPVGPHRIFDWFDLPLDEVKQIKSARGCSVNDVVLAIATGAFREFLAVRQERPEEIDFRVATPVDVRRAGDRGRLGNKVSSWIVPLPVGVADPLEALEQIQRTTRRMKESRHAAAVEMMTALRDWVSFDLQQLQRGTVNAFITNVPGPQVPLYMAGSKLLALYAQAPLIENLGLVMCAASYDGKLFLGFNADYDRVPDLDELVAFVRQSAQRLFDAAVRALPEANAPPAKTQTKRINGRRARSGSTSAARGPAGDPGLPGS